MSDSSEEVVKKKRKVESLLKEENERNLLNKSMSSEHDYPSPPTTSDPSSSDYKLSEYKVLSSENEGYKRRGC